MEKIHVGIVGGGQLAHFLCIAARGLGVQTTVLTPDGDCPASRSADQVLVAGLDDLAAAGALTASCDVVTFEIEGLSPTVLKFLGGRAAAGEVRVAPRAQTLLVLQNKALQKQWLVRHGHPTPAFLELPEGPPEVGLLIERLGLPLVQKSATGGYDGRGVQVLRDEASLKELWETPSVVEAYVSDASEIAVLVARGQDGGMAVYDPVLLGMDAMDNILDTAVWPAPLSEPVACRARRLAMDVVTDLAGVGMFAVEMFLTRRQDLLVNEVSPRVHNAGHVTLEACETSQFAQHLRAVLGLPLGSTRQRFPCAVMRNLLYTPGLRPLCEMEGFDLVDERTATAVHWYGKRQGRERRKMGHVTALGCSARSAQRRADAACRAVTAVGEVLA